MLAGRRLIDLARDLIAPFVDAVVVVGRPGGIPDVPGPDLGPLGGIAGALDHAAGTGHRCVLTIGCDMPRLPDGLIPALLRRAPAFCADAPILGHWPAACGAQLLAHLDRGGERSVIGWTRTIGAIPIPAPGPIANVNTREDLMAL